MLLRSFFCLSVCLFVCLSVCLSVFASATRLSCSEQADDFAESIYTTRWTRSRYSSALNKSKMVQDRAILTLAGTITVNVSRSTAELSMGWVDPRVGLGRATENGPTDNSDLPVSLISL